MITRVRPHPAATVPNIDLLPPAYRRVGVSSKEKRLLALLGAELLALALLWASFGPNITDRIAGLASGQRELQLQQQAQVEQLQKDVATARARLRALESARTELGQRGLDWPTLLDQLFQAAPASVAVSMVQEREGGIDLVVATNTLPDLTAYRDRLLQVKGVEQVLVQGLSRGADSSELTATLRLLVRRGGPS
ncbi:MAG: hypothetical protein HY683_09000 [Chloroflexi bacterium]|nr:hypothetical protein [Chloroflexota bacterium]